MIKAGACHRFALTSEIRNSKRDARNNEQMIWQEFRNEDGGSRSFRNREFELVSGFDLRISKFAYSATFRRYVCIFMS
jgi:hypothetical protein